MKIIPARFEFDLDTNAGSKILRSIEQAGRTCYKSEDNNRLGDADKTKKFVKMLLERGHESVLEHEKVTVRIICDRGATHEIVRHRIASYSQESTRYCVSGDMKLTCKNPHQQFTVKDLFDSKKSSSNGAWKRLLIRKLNRSTGELGWAKIRDVVLVGVQPVVKVRTHLGYELTCTPDHLLLQEDGRWVEARYVLGQKVAVNGVPLRGVANIGRTPWNKGLRAATNKKVAQASRGLKEYHWNGGHTKVPLPPAQRVRIRTESTYRKLVKDSCELCTRKDSLDVHHIDGDRKNNNDTNLITVCSSCHGRVHSKNLLFAHFDTVESVESAGQEKVFDISMVGKDRNFVANGVVVHNCNYGQDKFGNELTFIDLRHFLANPEARKLWETSMQQAETNYLELVNQHGVPPQFARSVLPNSLKTEIVVTANIREWRHIFKLRTPKAAHPQMQEIMGPLLQEFQKLIPVVFDDIEVGS